MALRPHASTQQLTLRAEGLAPEAGVQQRWAQGKGKSISNKAVSRSLRKCLDLGDGSDLLRLEVSRAAEVTQSILQWCLWLVGWWGLNIWELTSAALAPLPLRALSLANAHPLPMPLDHAHAVWFGTVQGCYCHGFSIYNMFPSLNLQLWHSLPSALFAHKHDSFPPKKLARFAPARDNIMGGTEKYFLYALQSDWPYPWDASMRVQK